MRRIEQPKVKVSQILQDLKDDNTNYLDLSDDKNGKNELQYDKIEAELIEDEQWYIDNFDQLIKFETSLSTEGIEDKIHDKYPEYNKPKTLKKYRLKLYELAKERCPICDCSFAYSQVNLDHVLPKSKYKALSITPINIVPICNRCNIRKNNKLGDKVFSPYFHEYDLTALLCAKIVLKNTDEDNMSIVIEVDESKKSTYGVEKDFDNIVEDISRYGILSKYSSLATIFLYEIIDYFKKMTSLSKKNLLFTKRLVKDLLAERDLFREDILPNAVRYCDETFIKHISIIAMKNNEKFLSIITNILNKNIDLKESITSRIKEAIQLIDMKQLPICPQCISAFIKKVFQGSDFVGYYLVKAVDDAKFECKLIDFQGPYQEHMYINFSELKGKWESFVNAIKTKKVQIASNQSHSDKISYFKNNIGTEIIIPVLDENEKCKGLVYIGLEGEIDSSVSIDDALLNDFQKIVSRMCSSV